MFISAAISSFFWAYFAMFFGLNWNGGPVTAIIIIIIIIIIYIHSCRGYEDPLPSWKLFFSTDPKLHPVQSKIAHKGDSNVSNTIS
jgi:hypothetical protein